MSDSIQINQLLMEREDLFVEVYDIERHINTILGKSYPLAPPDDLPSRQKRSKPKKQKAAEKPVVIKIRKLDPETESAYRITYIENDAEKVEIHLDPKPLALLANTSLPHINILQIETVTSDQSGEWECVEELM